MGAIKKNDPEAIFKILASFKGPAVKFGQLIANVPGILPSNWQAAFLKLQNKVPSMRGNFVKKRMVAELGENWEDHFDFFDLNAEFAASIGQIHFCSFQGKEAVAKLQYPNMDIFIESDFEQITSIVNLISLVKKPFVFDEAFSELKQSLILEYDYLNEAQNMLTFKSILDSDKVVVPVVFQDVLTKKLLVCSKEEGVAISEVSQFSSDFKRKAIRNLFHAWFFPFYKHFLIHADPHAGNFLFKENDARLVLFDYGSVQKFSFEFVQGIKTIRQGLILSDDSILKQGYELLGFKDLNLETIKLLNSWAKFVCFPILKDEDVLISHDYVDSAKLILKEIFDLANQSGGIKIPKSFVLFDRAVIGFGAACVKINVPFNYFKELENILS